MIIHPNPVRYPNLKWIAAKSLCNVWADAECWSWLLDNTSLTARLKQHFSGSFKVNLLHQGWGQPTAYEARKLGLKLPCWAIIREVELICEGQPVVYARSIIPHQVYAQNNATLRSLGSQPLGHLLFRKATQHKRSRDVCRYQTKAVQQPIYGRSTLYSYHQGEILVQEFFIEPSLLGI